MSLLACALCCCASAVQASDAGANLDRHIIVAIAERADPAPLPATTARGYASLPSYSGSARNRLTSAEIARDHQLVEIAAWNIDLLRVHCMLFEMPADAERESLLARLRRDRRVMLAQPQQSFSILSPSASGS